MSIQNTPHKERFGSTEWLLLLATLFLLVIGIAFISSARSPAEAADDYPLYRQFYFKQIVYGFVGLSLAVLFNVLDYHSWARWSLVFYWICVGVLVLVPLIGSSAGGAKRWIDLGLFNFQPSELAKLAFIFMLSSFLARPDQELRVVANFWKAIGMMVLPFVLILKEPDLGSALIFIPVGLMMMFVGGIPLRWLVNLGLAGGLVIALVMVDVFFAPKALQFIQLEEYQKQRLMVYFGMDFAPKNATEAERRTARQLQKEKSYQGQQALISVGSGHIYGKGWRQGSQTALGYLPPGAAHNDFIFSVIAEEKGFIGSATVVALYGVILFTGIRIASQARDRLGKLMAVGVVTLIFSHVFINIGMNIRLMPVTGVPLPLLSYGGTSVIVSLIAIGILYNVHLYRRAY
jgi:rod shape determining protein RodA